MTPVTDRNFGVIFLGASRFPRKADLDKASFAAAKDAVAAVLTADYLIAGNVNRLDLFDQDINQEAIVDKVDAFLSANPTISDLIIYYCGHGGFLPGASFYLTLRGTKEGREATTSLSLRQFRLDLEDLLLNKRIYLVLDCCYAASAVDDWQSDRGVTDVIADNVERAFPPSGTALIAAASRKTPALAPDELKTTLFSGHFAEAVRAGVKDARKELSFSDLADSVYRRIRNESLHRQVLPQLHVPGQLQGDVSRVPFIKNFGALSEPAKTEQPVQTWIPFYPANLKVTLTTPAANFAMPIMPPGALRSAQADTPEHERSNAKPSLAAESQGAARSGDRRTQIDRRTRGKSGGAKPATPFDPVPAPNNEKQARRYRSAVASIIAFLKGSRAFIAARAANLAKSPYVGLAALGTVAALVFLLAGPFTHPQPPSPVVIPHPVVPLPIRVVEPPVAIQLAKKPAPPAAPLYCGDLAADNETKALAIGGPYVSANVKIVPNMKDKAIVGAHQLRAVAITPDGSTIATGGDDGVLRVWDAASFKLRWSQPDHAGAIYALDFASINSSAVLASAGFDGKIHVRDANRGTLINEFDAMMHQYALNFYPHVDPAYLYSAGGNAPENGRTPPNGEGTVFVWNLKRPKQLPLRKSGATNQAIRTIAVSPSGHGLVAGHWDGTISFFVGDHVEPIKAFNAPVLRIAYSPDGKSVLAAGRDTHFNNLKSWTADGKPIKSFDGHPRSYVVSLAWSSDGKTFVSGGGVNDFTIRLWSPNSRSELRKYSGHIGDVEGVLFLADGNRLVSVSEDGSLRVWDVASAKEMMTLIPYDDGSYLAFTPQGCYSGSHGVESRFKIFVNGEAKELDPQLKRAIFNPNGFSYLAVRH